MRRNKFLYDLQVVIDKPDTDDEFDEESALDALISDNSLPDSVENVVNYIAHAEYNHTLEPSIYGCGWDKKVGINAHINYCLPDFEIEYSEETMSMQHVDKIFRWVVKLDADEDKDLTLSFFILYRDMFGNIRNLHRQPIEQKMTLYHSDSQMTRINIDVMRDDDLPFDCGRYYFAVQSRYPYQTLVQEPAVIYLNIVSPHGKIELPHSPLVGMEAVYHQMNKLITQRLFNERREAMGLSPTHINLHAAVMGGKGSGKTSFAKVLFDFYKKNGFIGDGKLHVVDAANWITVTEDASSVGSDMTKARNGLLYVENASAMLPTDTRGSRDYIAQALIKELRNNTHNTTVVLADEPDKLTEVLAIGDFKSFIGQIYHLPTLNLDQMIEVAENATYARGFKLTQEAKKTLRAYLSNELNATTSDVVRIVEKMIMNMSARVVDNAQTMFLENSVLMELTEDDVPKREISLYNQSIDKLNDLVGLKQLKYNIESHLNLVRFAQLRMQHGLSAVMPPLHMIFTGNPGTGKTTVAKLLGEIYASLGILKTGKVVSVDRKTLVGRYIGDTEDNTKRALERAHGNILFIDEAYNLVSDPTDKRDFGPKVIDCLLEELGKESTDMIIIMAGYPEDMEKLLDYNKGLQSRFPYTFHFEDYSEDELVEIAIRTAQQCGYTFSDEALNRLRSLIRREMERSAGREEHFGNARFITRLISSQIIPNMSRRVLASDTQYASPQLLTLIEESDIPLSVHETDYTVDEQLLMRALKTLDEMVGLSSVKKTLHDLVTIARSRQLAGEDIWKTIPLQWLFTGSTGTGKSSVARILAQLLHAFHLISSDRMTQLRLPASNAWTTIELDTMLRDTMKQSGQGLLFIDLDDAGRNHIDIQWLRCKLTSLTAEMPGSYAVVIAVDERNATAQPIDVPLSTSSIHFPDYSAEELMTILKQELTKHIFAITDEAEQIVREHIEEMCKNHNCQFANARTIQHIFTAITGAAQVRTAQSKIHTEPLLINAGDVQSFKWKQSTTNRIGFGS